MALDESSFQRNRWIHRNNWLSIRTIERRTETVRSNLSPTSDVLIHKRALCVLSLELMFPYRPVDESIRNFSPINRTFFYSVLTAWFRDAPQSMLLEEPKKKGFSCSEDLMSPNRGTIVLLLECCVLKQDFSTSLTGNFSVLCSSVVTFNDMPMHKITKCDSLVNDNYERVAVIRKYFVPR